MAREFEQTPSSKEEWPLTPESITAPSEIFNSSAPSIDIRQPDPTQIRGGWKHLFAFTRWTHAWTLVVALVAAAITAGLKTVLAVFLGEIFDVIAGFGSGAKNGSDTVREVTQWCLVLLGIGGGNWLSNMAFLTLWIVFGELQAHSARHDIFDTLLWKEMAWFDAQEHGISSLLVRIQTYVYFTDA